MSDLGLRLLERLHGQLGWLAVAALAHPAWLLRRPRRRAPLAAVLATLAVTLAGSLGAWLYPVYRLRVKQPLFLEAPAFGWLFERKEHLAVGAVLLAWSGTLAHLLAGRAPASLALPLGRAAHRAFVAATLLSLATAVMGLLVAARRAF